MKKINQQGIAHHLLIVGLAVLVVGAVGFAGFRVYKSKTEKARAGSYKQVISENAKGGTVSLMLCRDWSSDGSGQTYKAYLKNYSNYNASIWYAGVTASPHSVSSVKTVKASKFGINYTSTNGTQVSTGNQIGYSGAGSC
jgi:hypothetical protein